MFLEKIIFYARSLHKQRVVRYLVAGGTATATNLGILFILTDLFGVWYLYSSIGAMTIATVVSFTLQKFWTFQDTGTERIHIQFPLHVSLALLNIVLNTIFLYVFVDWFHVWYLLAQFVVAGLLACMNYFVYKHLIFRR